MIDIWQPAPPVQPLNHDSWWWYCVDWTRYNTVVEPEASKNITYELNEFLEKSSVQNKQQVDTFAKEINLFCSGKQLETDTVKEIHLPLDTIPPNSVEAERMFSASGLYLFNQTEIPDEREYLH